MNINENNRQVSKWKKAVLIHSIMNCSPVLGMASTSYQTLSASRYHALDESPDELMRDCLSFFQQYSNKESSVGRVAPCHSPSQLIPYMLDEIQSPVPSRGGPTQPFFCPGRMFRCSGTSCSGFGPSVLVHGMGVYLLVQIPLNVAWWRKS